MAYLTLSVTKRVDDQEIDSFHVLQYFTIYYWTIINVKRRIIPSKPNRKLMFCENFET